MPIAYGNNELLLAWEGRDEYLYVAQSKDGASFAGKHQLKAATLKSTRPGIAYGKGLIFLAWIDQDDRVNVIASPDGTYWGEKNQIADQTHRKCPPALAYFNDRLYLAWTERTHGNHISVTSFNVSDNGDLAHYGKATLDEESTNESGPALTVANDRLYLAWQSHNDRINVISSPDGKTFEGKVTLHEHSPHTATPGITFGNGFFYVAWIGTDDRLNLLSSSDGVTWSNKVTVHEKSTVTGVAGLAFGNGTLFLDWSGHEHQHHLNVMEFKIESSDGSLPAGHKTTLEDEAEK
jgi:hypothetical protein